MGRKLEEEVREVTKSIHSMTTGELKEVIKKSKPTYLKYKKYLKGKSIHTINTTFYSPCPIAILDEWEIEGLVRREQDFAENIRYYIPSQLGQWVISTLKNYIEAVKQYYERVKFAKNKENEILRSLITTDKEMVGKETKEPSVGKSVAPESLWTETDSPI